MINVPNPKMGGYSLISETHISLLNQATHFLTYEADLLDNWKLNEWIDLFSQDARYLIAPLDDGEFVEGNALFLAVDAMAEHRCQGFCITRITYSTAQVTAFNFGHVLLHTGI